MIEHHELYLIQRTALRAAGGGASLRSVTVDARGSSAYLGFRGLALAQLYIQSADALGAMPVDAGDASLGNLADFDGAQLLLLDNEADVRSFAAAPGAFGHASHLYRGKVEAGRLRWSALGEAPPGTASAQSAGAAATPPGKPAPEPWGLLPERPAGEPWSLRLVLRYYFVEFNPLFFISAFCLLYGVFEVAQHIEELGIASLEVQQSLLFGITQLYELLVIAAAALLAHRARAIRAAVLLALLECALLFDPTFRIESAAVQGAFGRLLIVTWLLLTAVKCWGLARALRLPVTRTQLAAVAGVAAAMAGFIAWLSLPGTEKRDALQAAMWFGALVVLLLERLRPALVSAFAGDAASGERAAACARAGYRLLIGFYFYHLWTWIIFSDDHAARAGAIPAQIGALFLYLLLVRDSQKDSWIFGLLTLFAAVFSPGTLPLALGLVALVWMVRVWRGGHSNLAIGAVFAAYAAASFPAMLGNVRPFPQWPAWLDWPNLILAAGLLFVGLRLRNRLALGILGAGLAWTVYDRVDWDHLLPKTELARGLISLVLGFVALGGGVAITWLFRSREEPVAAA